MNECQRCALVDELAVDSMMTIRTLEVECFQLRKAISKALIHLNTNYDIDGNCMKDSDAADCLREVMQ